MIARQRKGYNSGKSSTAPAAAAEEESGHSCSSGRRFLAARRGEQFGIGKNRLRISLLIAATGECRNAAILLCILMLCCCSHLTGVASSFQLDGGGRRVTNPSFFAPSIHHHRFVNLLESRSSPTSFSWRLRAEKDDGVEKGGKGENAPGKERRRKKKMKPAGDGGDDDDDAKGREKAELLKAVGEEMRSRRRRGGGGGAGTDGAAEGKGGRRGDGGDGDSESEKNIFDRLNPFKAGQSLRKTVGTAIQSINMPAERKSIYYLDDRLADKNIPAGSGSAVTEGNPLWERLDQDDFVPEVLVVGATGEVGRLVVRRLLLEGRCRVRVLVRNLYSKTLGMFGAGVTYCQGDLGNVDSLEYAVTDVDKIVFCASAPRPDEDQFQGRFEEYMTETLVAIDQGGNSSDDELQNLQSKLQKEETKTESDSEWEQLTSVLEVRARLAEQVDCIGVQNLVRAYQNVRHADYGTSQAAKRSLFKFQDRPEDFNLFAIDEGDDDDIDVTDGGKNSPESSGGSYSLPSTDDEFDEYDYEDDYEYDESNYEDYYDDDDDQYSESSVEERRGASVKTQCQWIRNQFEHGVFVGRVPKATGGGTVAGGGEAAVASSRLRSRDDPENGIDLSAGFGGFIARVCSDGGTYEAFVRTKEYYEHGIEYVCEFSTATKPSGSKNKSSNKFATIRLPFDSFKPVKRSKRGDVTTESAPPFKGRDVRNIGFRYRSASNSQTSKLKNGEWSSFYLALCYIKLYRSQPEPEFVYLSDARIPPVIRNGMVRHEARQLVAAPGEGEEGSGGGTAVLKLLDESTLTSSRSQEETYFKFRGEEIIKNSGLSYAIVRVSGYNESPSGEASTIDLKPNNEDLTPVSRADVAQVCAGALLDPSALNKSFYVSKKRGSLGDLSLEEDLSRKFAALPKEEMV